MPALHLVPCRRTALSAISNLSISEASSGLSTGLQPPQYIPPRCILPGIPYPRITGLSRKAPPCNLGTTRLYSVLLGSRQRRSTFSTSLPVLVSMSHMPPRYWLHQPRYQFCQPSRMTHLPPRTTQLLSRMHRKQVPNSPKTANVVRMLYQPRLTR